MSSTMMTTINLKATIAACTEFGSRIGEKLSSREGDQFDIALKACLLELNDKPITKKAVKKSSPKAPSATKLSTIVNLTEKITALGGEVDEGIGIGELRTMLKSLKAVNKAKEVEAKKEATALKKAKAKAIKDAEKEAKAAAKLAKVGKKTPTSEYTVRVFPNDKEREDWKGKNGKYLRYAVHKIDRTLIKKVQENWTDEANAKFAMMFPKGKVVIKKKITKKKKIIKKPQEETLQDEQAALIATLVAAPKEENNEGGESKNGCDNADEAIKEANKSVVESPEEIEELEEIEEIEEIQEEPEFPGEAEVEDFVDDSLTQYENIDFYKDTDSNIWDENMDFVGTYDEDSEEVSIKKGYQPDE